MPLRIRVFGLLLVLFFLNSRITGQVSPTVSEPEGPNMAENVRDSLLNLLSSTQDEARQAEILNNFANWYRNDNHEISLQCAHRALQIADRIGDAPGQLAAHINLGDLYTNYVQNYDLGLQHLNEALTRNRQTDNRRQEIYLLRLLGYLHNRTDNSTAARDHYQQAIDVARQQGWKQLQIDLHTDMADMYMEQGRTDYALPYYKVVLEHERATGFKNTRPETKISLASYAQLQNDLQQAVDLCTEAVEDFMQVKNFRWAAYAWCLAGDMELQRGHLQQAIEYAQTGLALAEQNNLNKELADNHEVLAAIYDSLGDYRNALHHFRALTAVNNKMFSVDRATQIAAIQSDHALELKERELHMILREKADLTTRNRVIFAAGGVVLLLLCWMAFTYYRSYRQKQHISEELADRVELKDLALTDIVRQLKQEIAQHQHTRSKLDQSAAELNHFIYKSSHDLRGPLASISGLVHLASVEDNAEERAEYLNLIGVSTMRLSKKLDALIQATRLTEGQLDLQPVRVEAHLRSVLRELGEASYAQDVDVHLDASPELEINSDVHLLKILTGNLIDNAMKYRRKSDTPSMVMVSAQVMDDRFMLSVGDNGRGIPLEKQDSVFNMFVRSDQDYESYGLGLYLVKKTVDKLSGTITLESEEGVGTKVVVQLPLAIPT